MDADERKRRKDEYLRHEHDRARSRLPVDRPQLESLVRHLEKSLEVRSCDHTLALTNSWAVRNELPLDALRQGLADFGGYCDCEVVMNVDPDEIFEPVRGSGHRDPSREE